MPPLRVEIEIGEKKIKLPDIPPGIPGSFSDLNTMNPSVLIVSCNPEDNGGIVYRQDPGDTKEVRDNRLRLVHANTGNIETVIGDGEAINLPITTKIGQASLTLTHYR